LSKEIGGYASVSDFRRMKWHQPEAYRVDGMNNGLTGLPYFKVTLQHLPEENDISLDTLRFTPRLLLSFKYYVTNSAFNERNFPVIIYLYGNVKFTYVLFRSNWMYNILFS
jgi:hypothetical protein